jgi:hypothetical protein
MEHDQAQLKWLFVPRVLAQVPRQCLQEGAALYRMDEYLARRDVYIFKPSVKW